MDFKVFVQQIIDYVPKISIVNIIEILIIMFLLYQLFCLIKDTKTWLFVKGLCIFAVLYFITDLIGFHVIKTIFEQFFGILSILLVIIFQQEIRRALGEIGKTTKKLSLFQRKKDEYEKYYSDDTIDSIVRAAKDMAKVKTGALIVLQRGIPLNDYRDTGISIDSAISKQILVQMFEKNTPLHDGALIINNDRIEAATCYLPLSNSNQINKDFGTRHRAGIGITENTDCITVIISEETGNMSVTINGEIKHAVSEDTLKQLLMNHQMPATRIRKKKEKGMRNIKTKLGTVFAAFALWVIMTNYIDPSVSITIKDVPVEIKNASIITNKGMSYEVTSGSTTDVIVKGRKSSLDNIDETDVFAYADLSNLSISNASEIIVSCSFNDTELIPVVKNMKVNIEPTKEVEHNIEIKQEGSLKSDNYIRAIDLQNKTLKISGGESKINVIGNVIVTVDITNAKDGDVVNVRPVIYDKNGKEMDKKLFKLSVSETSATINMCNTKKVPLIINAYCEHAGNGEIIETKWEKEEITIAADDEILENTEAIIIDVGMDIVPSDESRIFEYTKVVNLENYMPEGINCAEADSQVNVEVVYEQYITKTVLQKVDIIGQSKRYQYEAQPVTITLKGLQEDLNLITEESFSCTANVKGLDEGEHVVPLELSGSNLIIGDYSAKIKISEG